MAAPLTEREMFIARYVFESSMQVVLDMCAAGLVPERFCRLALDDPQKEMHLRDKLTAEFEMREGAGIPIPGERHADS